MKTLQEKFVFKQMKKITTTKSFLVLQVKNVISFSQRTFSTHIFYQNFKKKVNICGEDITFKSMNYLSQTLPTRLGSKKMKNNTKIQNKDGVTKVSYQFDE